MDARAGRDAAAVDDGSRRLRDALAPLAVREVDPDALDEVDTEDAG